MGLKKGEKGKREKGEKGKMLFLVPKLLLGNGIMPQALLGNQDGKGEKGKNLGFLLPPVFPVRLKAIIAPKTLV